MAIVDLHRSFWSWVRRSAPGDNLEIEKQPRSPIQPARHTCASDRVARVMDLKPFLLKDAHELEIVDSRVRVIVGNIAGRADGPVMFRVDLGEYLAKPAHRSWQQVVRVARDLGE